MDENENTGVNTKTTKNTGMRLKIQQLDQEYKDETNNTEMRQIIQKWD